MNRRVLALLAVILLLAVGIAFLLTRVGDSALVAQAPLAATPEPRTPERSEPARDKAAPAVRPPAIAVSDGRAAPPATPQPGTPALPMEPSGEPSTPANTREPADANGTAYKIDRDGIRAAIRSQMPEIRECYEAWLQQNPRLQGRMVVGFEISADDAGAAEVTQVSLVDGGLGQPFMEGCVLNAFQDLRFEKPPGGGGKVTVNYPITFQLNDAGTGDP